jgi:sugar phosphate isomerase/epimerase
MPNVSRRTFLGTAAGAASLTAVPAGLFGAARKKIPIGVQLYSVRKNLQADMAATLAGVKKIGYDAVEFADYYAFANDAKGLRKLLDDNGLKVCGSHIYLNTIEGDALAKTVEFNQTIGNPNLVVRTLSAQNTATADAWAKTAEEFNQIAAKLTPLKMNLGYHNHATEFVAIDGQIPWDIFVGKTNKNVYGQLDIGHCQRAGADPVVWLKKFPGRTVAIHVKDYSPTNRAALIGEGTVKWADVFEACETVAGTQWYIVEEESNAYPDLTGIEKSLANLKKLLA